MTDAVVRVRPLNVDEELVPVDRAEIVETILRAGYSQASVCREMVVKYRTWMHWMKNGQMPGTAYAILAMLIGLPEPAADVNVPRAPWVFLRRVEDLGRDLEDLVARLDRVEERVRDLEARLP
jgi:hypothetical protein